MKLSLSSIVVFLSACGSLPVQDSHWVFRAPLVLTVTSGPDIQLVVQEVVGAINAACGTELMAYDNRKVIDDNTVTVVESTEWVQNNSPAGNGRYEGFCTDVRPDGSCRAIHVLDFIVTREGVDHMDLEEAHRILTHELGHSLGLMHNLRPDNIMNAGVPKMTVSLGYVSLAADLESDLGACPYAANK